MSASPRLARTYASPKFLRVRDAAERLSVSKSFIRSLIAEGLLPAVRATLPGRSSSKAPLLIDASDLAAIAARFERVQRTKVEGQ